MQGILHQSRRHGTQSIIRYDTLVNGGALIKATMTLPPKRSVGNFLMQTFYLRGSIYQSTDMCPSVVESKQYAATSKMYHSRSIWSNKKSLTMIPCEFGLRCAPYRVYSKSGLATQPETPKPPGSMSNLQAGNENRTNDGTQGAKEPLINQRAVAAILKQLASPPNILTLSRIAATPYLSYLLVSHHHGKINAVPNLDNSAATDATISAAADAFSCITTNIDPSSTPVFALSLFLAMGFTDYLDGYIARTFPSTATIVGTYLDPFADKVFIGVMSFTLWYVGTLPGLLVGLWVARDVGMFGSAYWMVRSETLKRRKNMNSNVRSNDGADDSIAIMDPTRTPLKVQANFLSKVNTSLQIGLIALGIAGEVPSINIPSELVTTLW